MQRRPETSHCTAHEFSLRNLLDYDCNQSYGTRPGCFRRAAFYDAVLKAIGARRVLDFGTRIGYGVEFPSFWIGPLETGDGFRESHIAFTGPTREAVMAFRDAAVGAGAEVLHEPRVWPEYHPGYFGAFVSRPRREQRRSCAPHLGDIDLKRNGDIAVDAWRGDRSNR